MSARTPVESQVNHPASRLTWLARVLQFALVALALLVLLYLIALEMDWPQQAVLSVALLLLAFWLDRFSKSHVITLTMMGMSLFATCRYGYWRLHNVVLFFGDARSRWGWLDAVFILMLVSAEVYAFVILVLGYIQTVWPLRRPPAPLPDDPTAWPEIDLLIPTYNEPLSVVRYTALAALNIDWPPEKLHVYILDDGRREEFRAFADAAHVGYLTRTGNEGAKAGNINRALEKTRSPYVAIFDCDHVPTRSFLQMTVGWFLRDKQLGMLQTPHHFYSPDPFERNLGQFRTIPNEGELFYGIVQDGNDFWNASFFCGSCAVLRRTAIMEIGGIATATVTEDAHTSLLIQKNGWNTAYINLPQAAGLATESLSGHVSQRVRWARGMVQILRLDNPLFARGLSLPQRLCYFNAMMHFMYAVPRLIFLTAPLLYLIFSLSNVPGYWAAILAFALPHLVLSSTTNSRIQGMHRHSFWNEIYETVLAPYILAPTMMALINPRLGKFNVTAKGGVVEKAFFDRGIARPFVALLGANLLGLLMAIPRLVHVPGLPRLWDGRHPGTVAMNVVWTLFNIVIVSVATAVARESQQRRGQVRITVASPVSVVLPNGVVAPGDTTDLSSSGACVQLTDPVDLPPGQEIQLVFALRGGNAALPVVVRGSEGAELRLQFAALNIEQQALLTEALYSSADSWLSWDEAREPDKPLRSLARILQLSFRGLGIALRSLVPARQPRKLDRPALGASRAGVLWFAALLLPSTWILKNRPARAAELQQPAPIPGKFSDAFTLRENGVTGPIVLRGRASARSVNFSLPPTELAQQASLHVVYHLPTSQAMPSTAVRVLLNGEEVGMLSAAPGSANNALLQQDLALPAELLVQQNQLTFALPGEASESCQADALPPQGVIDPETRLMWSGSLLSMADDLTRLPQPFLDPETSRLGRVPIVLAAHPSREALQSAGILASYFGLLAGDHGVLFPVSLGQLPTGNAIVIAEDPGLLAASLERSQNETATVSIRTNPADPSGRLLILTGSAAGQLVTAAQAIALHSKELAGDTASIQHLLLPERRVADDAPRWSRTDRPIPLSNAAADDTPADGSAPVNVYLRLPPDLAYLNRASVPLTLAYHYNPLPLSEGSAAQVVVNAQYVGATLLPPGHDRSRTIRGHMELATSTLRPFSNSLTMSFALRSPHQLVCPGAAPTGMNAALLDTSNLDLRGVPHWATLPNLELLANAGFPFTRYADLDQTDVVLPREPGVEEIALYLMLLGHFGAQTGYPALRLRVEDQHALQPGNDRDVLLIGSLDDQPALGSLAQMLPIAFDGSGLTIQEPRTYLSSLRNLLQRMPGYSQLPGALMSPADSAPTHFARMPDVWMAGLESPYSAGRSLVLFVVPAAAAISPDGAGGAGWMRDFLRVSQSSAISGALTVVQGGEFFAYPLRRGSYHVGRLPRLLQLNLWLTDAPWSVPGGVLACCLPLAFCTRGWLARRAAARLAGREG